MVTKSSSLSHFCSMARDYVVASNLYKMCTSEKVVNFIKSTRAYQYVTVAPISEDQPFTFRTSKETVTLEGEAHKLGIRLHSLELDKQRWKNVSNVAMAILGSSIILGSFWARNLIFSTASFGFFWANEAVHGWIEKRYATPIQDLRREIYAKINQEEEVILAKKK